MNTLDRAQVLEICRSGFMLVLLVCLYAIYSLGFDGIFSFDDPASLEGLLSVKDWHSALFYITTSETGPLGRPLSLASFILNAPTYPYSATGFLYTNALIHLLNVCLVALVLVRLQRQTQGLLPESPWFVPLTAGFWGLLPILVSTSMMVVQRMTSLSALFVLLGIWIYLWGREHHDRAAPVIFTVFGIGLCTLLAAFSKENGALLPLYLVVLEFTLLSNEKTPNHSCWPAWLLRGSILLPSLLLAGYLLSRIPGLPDAYEGRPFNLGERLATQTVILWDYLRLSFLPRPFALGPFHDDYPIYHFSDVLVWLALSAWLAAIGLAIRLRRTYPLIAFAVFWYLAGHLLESSIIPLELYFEHRNYLPILGPVIVLAALAGRMPIAPRAKAGIISAYLAFLVFVLWQTLSIWGHRELELWARAHPNSPKGIQMMAQAYAQAGRTEESLHLLDEALARKPELSSVAMQSLRLRCYRNNPHAFAARLTMMRQTLGTSDYSSLTLQALDAIRQLHERGGCSLLQATDLHTLTDLLLGNPMFRARASARQYLHRIKAQLYLHEGQLAPTVYHLEQAFAASPDLGTAVLLFTVLHNSRQTQAAQDFLKRATEQASTFSPWLRQQWLSTFDQIRQQTSNQK